MSPERRRAASPARDTATSRNTTDNSTVPRGSEFAYRLRRKRRVSRQCDRQMERLGDREHYPYPAA